MWFEDFEYAKNYALIYVGFQHDDYINNYYEVLNDDLKAKYFTFSIDKTAEAFVGIQFYDNNMYPNGCHKMGNSKGYLSVFTASGAAV